jgi:uncharacterized protein YjiS (DUF1127 family)
MLTDDEIELGTFDWRVLTPDEREALRQWAIRRGLAERDAVIRATFRGMWSRLRSLANVVQAGGAAALNWWPSYLVNRKRKIAVTELLALDDRVLKDIGVSRSEILAVVHAEDSSRIPPGMTSQKGRDKITACVLRSSAPALRASISPI